QRSTDQVILDIERELVHDRVAARLNSGKPRPRGSGAMRRGRGVAVAIKAVIGPTTSVANLTIAGDGSTTLYCGTIDMGEGSDPAMAQLVGGGLDLAAVGERRVTSVTHVSPRGASSLDWRAR